MFFGDNMLEILNKIVWVIATSLIIVSSFYFSHSLRFVQLNFKEMFKNLFYKNNDDRGISPIQSFLMTLGSRIGVGSIAGVALALHLGGPGSIFWMWISAFLAAANTFSETVLGIVYRKKDGDEYKGGPSYYLKYGLSKPKLGGLYAILILISYVLGFVGIQGNTITKSLLQITNVSPIIVGIFLVVITSFVIFGGLKKIASYSEKFVPFMTVLYIGISIFVAIKNFTLLPGIFLNIIKSAFTLKSAYGGLLGSLIVGVQRGIFSNEAGLGTGSITSSTSSIKSSISQGYIQMLGIYVTTILICTATAIIIMCSNYTNLNINDVNGIEITQFAFHHHLGNIGDILLFLSVLLFSYTTILTGYYDGESSLKYFFKKVKNKYLIILKLVSLFVLFLGCVVSSEKLWAFVDIMMAFLAMINIYALISLRTVVKEELQYYNHQKCGKINKR